ncbi:gamma-glutamylcyclotransferase family protein [Variovorax sp. dw_308]|uniref:gamma-glutamylcyclotransferase family protein n=1 Tax=Variovorax sp. dw_308 TaxID=2721546 RepID=UPI003527448A
MTTATQDAAAEWLFSYGTLQLEPVQRATFGRLLSGQPDSLPGYRLEQVAIRDAAVVATSGKGAPSDGGAHGKAERSHRGNGL